MAEITLSEVMERIKGLDEETQKRMICALVGHSKIQESSFGYYHCARCGEQVGDALGSIYPEAEHVVIVGHNCNLCKANYEKCTWKDTLMAPNPFATNNAIAEEA